MKKLLALSLSAAMLITPTVSFAQEKDVSSSITEQQSENEGDIYTESIEYNIDTNRQNIQSLSVPTDVNKEIESGATLTSYSENKKFVVLQGDKYHFVTKTEAEEMKEKNGVKSLSELVDEKKAINALATLNKEGVSPSLSDETNFSTSSVYDQDSVTMWDIKGELYTYTLPGTSTNASRAQLYALWSGVSLLPQYADSNPDYLSMGWATSEVMPTESVSSYVTYADYSSNPKKVTTVDIKNNREIWEHGKISLFYNDKYYGAYTTPTQASLSIVLGKKNKSGAVGTVATELGHTYSVTSGKISPSIQVSWPPVVSISYSSNTTGGVKRVPLKGYFQF